MFCSNINPRLSEHDKIAEASRQFEEGVLLPDFGEFHKTVIQSKLADNSTAAGISSHDMVTASWRTAFRKSGALGSPDV